MDKSFSDPNQNLEKTPTNYVVRANKRRRDDVSFMDFNNFKEENKDMISSLLSAHQSDYYLKPQGDTTNK